MKNLNQSLSNNDLVAVLCGLPFSGTTFLSRIICGHMRIDSGFECGLLFEESPRHFINRKKFYNWMMSHERPYNWKLTSEEMSYICDTENFYESYSRIVQKCHLFRGAKNKIVDKTPAYIYRLRNTMVKVDETPFIVIRKQPHFQYYSYKNRGKSIDQFISLYQKQNKSLERIINRPILNKRLLIVEFEDLNQNIERTIDIIFNHIKQFSQINYDSSLMMNDIIKSTQNDINSNKKKLRKKFDYTKEINSFEKSLSLIELKKLGSLIKVEK